MPRQEPGEPYFRVDSVEAKQMLDADPDNTVVIDVRRRTTNGSPAIATGAIHIPIDDLPDRLDELPRARSCCSSAPWECAAGWPANSPWPAASTRPTCTT